MDTLSKEQRSRNMSLIRSGDTKPEVAVRSLLHRLGFRFRKNDSTLPGKPDVLLHKYKTVIFVHGCFWHRHAGCKRAPTPKSNSEYWNEKLTGNTKRDSQNSYRLRKLGWKVKVVWECEIKNEEVLARKLQRILKASDPI